MYDLLSCSIQDNTTVHECHTIAAPDSLALIFFTSACIFSDCVRLMLRLNDDSSISSLRERSSVLKECSSVTACGREENSSIEKDYCSTREPP